ncbi:WD40-like repeat protein [Halovivax ruber XH-70]|uniref:WD40-like repeat protein n=1 Tax=Halovivax ruber (strain DSM 18193 / JCM 13892 / XH-70) TaxID=797302 RepID=L0I804_HALRX|nr:PQQ-binding-like beta-propeller repeat protein [Halovivax ruber]AGB14804.1 WD40-like repeat protein [Halovivax ruber XH-70]
MADTPLFRSRSTDDTAATNDDPATSRSDRPRTPESEAKPIARRTLLRTGAITGVAVAGLGGVGAASAEGANGGTVVWTYGDEAVDCSPPPATFEAPLTVVDGRVYAGTTCTHVRVIDATTGDEVETIYTNATTNRAPNVVDDIVTVAPNNQELMAYDLQAVDARSQRIWEADVGGSVTTRVSAPTVADGTAYTTNHDGPPYLHATNLWTGESRWTYDEHELGESPVVVDGRVYAAGRDGVLVSVDTDGDEEWTYDVGAPVEAAPTVADGIVYVGAIDGSLHAVDAASGEEEWRFDTDGDGTSTPTVADGVVYVGSHDDHLYAIDATSGDREWRYDTGGRIGAATVASGRVFVSSRGARVFALDAASGEEAWQVRDDDLDHGLHPDMTAPTVVDGIVYVASTDGQDGRVHAIDAGVSGSSEDSRVMLGTSGHHDAWAEAAAVGTRPEANGDGEAGTGDTSGTDTPSSGSDGRADGADDDDGLPGPGILGAIASIGGAAYLLAGRAADRGEKAE